MVFPWYFHGLRHRIVFLIDTYGDLLSPMHRWFAQIALSASGQSSEDASAVGAVSDFHFFVTDFPRTAALRHRLGAAALRAD